MNRLLKYVAVVGINLIVAFLSYYIIIKLILRIEINDAIPLVAIGVICFILGCIRFFRKNGKEKRDRGNPVKKKFTD